MDLRQGRLEKGGDRWHHPPNLSSEERSTPHIKETFELLVMQHPSDSEFTVYDSGDWAMARKHGSEYKTLTLAHRESYRDVIAKLRGRVRRLRRRN